jgi:hypothetical protein
VSEAILGLDDHLARSSHGRQWCFI